MPQYYTPPTGNDTVGFFELMKYTNDVVDGTFITGLLLIQFVVFFIASKQFSSSRAFAFSSFISMVLSILLAVLNLINPRFMYIFIILTGIGLVWMKLETQ